MLADMGDDFPAIRKHMRDQREPVVVPRPTHEREAKRILAEPAYGYSEGNDPHGAALAHATLYLAEQTRLSNLIQWAAITNNTVRYRAEIDEGLRT